MSGDTEVALRPATHLAGLPAGPLIGRPLLGVSKARLAATARALTGVSLDAESGAPWVVDACNGNVAFRRNAIMAGLRAMQLDGAVSQLSDAIDRADEGSADVPPSPTAAAPSQRPPVDLGRMQQFFKDVRRDLHADVSRALSTSALWDAANGDATLVLNASARAWLPVPAVATRVVSVLMQMAAGRAYPARTRRLLAMHAEMRAAHDRWARMAAARSARVAAAAQGAFGVEDDVVPYDATRRVVCPQMVAGGATVLPLARDDALRRIQRSALAAAPEATPDVYGPAFLVAREPPAGMRTQDVVFGARVIGLPIGSAALWDGRIWLARTLGPSDGLEFQASFATLSDVRAVEALTRGKAALRGARRRLLDWAARTPGSHYYSVPVVRVVMQDGSGDLDPQYLAFPTLGVEVPEPRFGWTTSCEGDALAVDRFKCLP